MQGFLLLFSLLVLGFSFPFPIYKDVPRNDLRPAEVCPPWPNAFSIGFNVTVVQFSMFGGPSTLYYDYSQRAQRIDFGLCSASGNFGPCTVLFKNNNVYTIQNKKCTVQTGIPTLPPDWTKILVRNGSSVVYGQPVYLYSYPGEGDSPPHYYYINQMKSPVFLLVTDIDEQWAFTSPFVVAPQPPSLFILPPICN